MDQKGPGGHNQEGDDWDVELGKKWFMYVSVSDPLSVSKSLGSVCVFVCSFVWPIHTHTHTHTHTFSLFLWLSFFLCL